MLDQVSGPREGLRATVERTAWLCAQPIDPTELAELERAGVIEKHGTWYRLLQPMKVPEHLLKKVTEMKVIDGEKALVKINSSIHRARTLCARLGVDWQGPEPK